jgi:hypothetical protein
LGIGKLGDRYSVVNIQTHHHFTVSYLWIYDCNRHDVFLR